MEKNMTNAIYSCEQTKTGNARNALKCHCDLKAPPMRIIRSPEFNIDLAQFYRDLDRSGDATVDWVLTEIYDHRDGRLFGPDGKEIPVDADATVFDELFGQDQRRAILRYRDKAARPPKRLLDRRCTFTVVILHLVRQINLCRTQGQCSH
jgi:hypothetical protein